MGKGIEAFRFLYFDVSQNLEIQKYSYMDTGGYINYFIKDMCAGNITRSMQVYWKEMLLRIHFAATISIIRNLKWLDGVCWAIKNKNLLVFSA